MNSKDWISVKDRLPELTEPLTWFNDETKMQEVMIKNFKVTVLAWDPEIGVMKAELRKDGRWIEISSISSKSTINVTHWMTLPEPPDQQTAIIVTRLYEKKYCLVKVYNDHWSFHIEFHKGAVNSEGFNTLTSYPVDGGGGTKPIAHKPVLPPGKWSIAGFTDNMSEMQKKEIIEYVQGCGYRDYMAPSGAYQWCATLDQSFKSWLGSIGADKTFAILKEIK